MAEFPRKQFRRPGRRSRALWIFASGLLAGCATAAVKPSDKFLSDTIIIEREALACKRSIASQARYQNLTGLLPLAAPYQASVIQMTDADLANDGERRALTAWTQDIQKCRGQVIQYVRQSSPVSLASQSAQ
jgi:hypothetical protein